MPNPDNGKIFENSYGLLTDEVRAEVEITLEYLKELTQRRGQMPSQAEFMVIAQRSSLLIYKGITPEEEARKKTEGVLQSWGVDLASPDRLKAENKVQPLSRTEYDLLVMFASFPGNIVTFESVQERFGWDNHGAALSLYVKRINDKLLSLGEDATIELVSVRGFGYRADPKSGTPTSSTLDLEEYPPAQSPAA